MVHSVELVLDRGTEAAVRNAWESLRAEGIPAQSPAARPHVTLVVAERIDPAVIPALAPVLERLPVRCRIGGALVFGRSAAVLARSVVPSAELLDLHATVCRVSADYLAPRPMPHTEPGEWAPHITLGRRIPADGLAAALRLAGDPAELVGEFVGLRYWDGNAKREFPI